MQGRWLSVFLSTRGQVQSPNGLHIPVFVENFSDFDEKSPESEFGQLIYGKHARKIGGVSKVYGLGRIPWLVEVACLENLKRVE
jgi:hypothetical protein